MRDRVYVDRPAEERKMRKKKAALPLRPKKVADSLVLGEIPSATVNGRTYRICLDRNNHVFCECAGWNYRHACTHLDAFRAALAKEQ
jgi:hypothetical protein